MVVRPSWIMFCVFCMSCVSCVFCSFGSFDSLCPFLFFDGAQKQNQPNERKYVNSIRAPTHTREEESDCLSLVYILLHKTARANSFVQKTTLIGWTSIWKIRAH